MRSRTVLAAGALAVLALASASAARAGDLDLPAHEKTLDNGMKVIVLEDHSIPNCALYVWWKVGSRNEVLGATGVAHFFEHMMFRGGAKYGKTFDSVMEAAGGSNNAFTERDVTVYQDWFPKEALPLILDIERDRMSGMVFDPAAVKAERDVVSSEWRSDFEIPAERVDVQLWASAFTEHPYRWSVLGWWNDVRSWETSDLQAFYERNYAPNNATLVLVGDVDQAAAMAAIEAALGGVPRKPEREPLKNQETPQRGERRSVIESSLAPTAEVRAAWHICRPTDPDFPVYEVLETLLYGGESSRLHRSLVEELEYCQSVGGGWEGMGFDPGLFSMDLTLRAGVDPAKAETAAYIELERLARTGPTARELTKAKNSIEATFVRRLKTIDSKAHLLGETATFFGDWRALPARVENVRTVTAADVRRVLTEVLTKSNRTVVTLVPVKGPGGDDAEDGDDGGGGGGDGGDGGAGPDENGGR